MPHLYFSAISVIIQWVFVKGGRFHAGEDRTAGWVQPDVPRVPCAADADERAGRHADERRARLYDDAAQGHRRGTAGGHGGGAGRPRADPARAALRGVQGDAQADAGRAARAGPRHSRVDRPHGHPHAVLRGLRGGRHPRHRLRGLRARGARGGAGHRRPRFLSACRRAHDDPLHQARHHRHGARHAGVHPRDLRPLARAADRRQGPHGRRLGQHPRRAGHRRKDGGPARAAVRQPASGAGPRTGGAEGQAGRAAGGAPRSGGAEL